MTTLLNYDLSFPKWTLVELDRKNVIPPNSSQLWEKGKMTGKKLAVTVFREVRKTQ